MHSQGNEAGLGRNVNMQNATTMQPMHDQFVSDNQQQRSDDNSYNGNSASSLSAKKNELMGAAKESMGMNSSTRAQGTQQRMAGQTEQQDANAQRNMNNVDNNNMSTGMYNDQDAMGTQNHNNNPSKMRGMKDQMVGSMKKTMGMTSGATQEEHGKMEKQAAKMSNTDQNSLID